MNRRPLQRVLGVLLVIAGVLSMPVAYADPPTVSLSGVPGASAAVARLPSNDNDFVQTLVATLRDDSPGYPFDVTRLRSDAHARVQLIQSFGPVLQHIVASDAFRTAYTAARQALIASRAGDAPRAPDATRADQANAMRQAIGALDQQMHSRDVPAALRAQLQQSLTQMRQQLAQATSGSTTPDQAAQYQQAQQDYQQQVASATQAVETDMPANPNTLVARRLDEFITLTASMPWTTHLSPTRQFTDPSLESKSNFWKLCFRAGQPTVDAARAFAQQWSASLRGAPAATAAASPAPGAGSHRHGH